MNQKEKLEQGWQLMQYPPDVPITPEILQGRWPREQALPLPSMPLQVQEALALLGKIRPPQERGAQEECLWVAQQDWLYLLRFQAAATSRPVLLHLDGVDTLADVYLNGALLGHTETVLLPVSYRVEALLQGENILVVHLHSNHHYLKTHPLPPQWQKTVRWYRAIRSFEQGYTDYLGAKPYFTRMGLYDDVYLEYPGPARLEEDTLTEATLSPDLRGGVLQLRAEWAQLCPAAHPLWAQAEVTGPTGSLVLRQRLGNRQACALPIPAPQLWWPVGYGSQPLYQVTVILYCGEEPIDRLQRKVGFRQVELTDTFACRINGVPVRFWGANLAPSDGVTNRYQTGRMEELLDRVENANMNMLRVWGSGERLAEHFYCWCDEHGILLWQEFMGNYGMYPEDEAYRAICRQEAEYTVRRLRHHPSILLWCGGNECFMGHQFDCPEQPYIGGKIFTEDYAGACQRLDPGRRYLVNSPYGGSFANDPAGGDTHSYTNTWFVPGSDSPFMVSENLRVAPPALRSMRRFLQGALWPEGYTGLYTAQTPYPWPESWQSCTSAGGELKIPPIEQFYDANTPQELIYRFSAAYSRYIRDTVELYRRGNRREELLPQRRCNGHLLWKLNATWFHIYSSVLDYYLEPAGPYYALKRAYAPVLLSLDISDHIRLWAVNDTPRPVAGKVTAWLWDVQNNRRLACAEAPCRLEAGSSAVVLPLDCFGQFLRKHLLCAELTDEATGAVLAHTSDFAEIERHLRFPEPQLSVQVEGEELLLSCGRFARWVEIEPADDGFGWLFSDNYFDLLPGEQKRVRILKGRPGALRVKAHFSNETCTVQWKE